ncbi:modification methylase NmeDIP [Akkermansia muciniphila]|nr:modification methylase NmeDIP [Akkermansia muciniphila]
MGVKKIDIEVFSFFSGLGLLDLGFENAGFNIVFVNEYNKRFLQAYQYARKNSGHLPVYGYSDRDIREYLSDDVWHHSFPTYDEREKKLIGFIGGPPCPDFSVAGKNIGKDGANGQLTSIYTNLIIKRNPDFFVFENVKGLYQTKKHRKFYNEIKTQFQKSGYKLFDSIENSLEYGVPQYRNRLFLIGFSTKTFGRKMACITSSHKKYNLDNILSLPWPITSPFSIDNKLDCPKGIPSDLTVEFWFNKNKVETHPNGKDIFRVKAFHKYESIYEGATIGKSFKRLHRWRYAPTSAYGNNEVHLHPYKMRRISVAEALALQSAPADFILPAHLPLSSKFKMIGNGVPVLLSQGIAMNIMDTIRQLIKGETYNV